MNAWDVALLIAVAAVLGLAVRRLVSNRRRGRSACGCDCAGCARRCGCREERPD